MGQKRQDSKVKTVLLNRELLSKLHVDMFTTKVILLGDLNYRINLDHIDVIKT